ncbi:alpha,alpha-trehalose-phosphate synthase-like protein subunit Tps2 [Trichodelitschia bisporula]|uniref:Alpha,alpha-trehalose-phosphate synthase-like protein subunit Tps2 n=1 Tax=Trichodelitschia bisporula TaxID=703511 RepID=A0A6G1I2J1_9PEZI|nr:alpha,alpha-trehalose-phosphate synthase-like protein subunit Tps2 [Trichodelitschia bisporula]
MQQGEAERDSQESDPAPPASVEVAGRHVDTPEPLKEPPPVTPGVHASGQSAYFEQNVREFEQLGFDPATATPGPQWNANTYFVKEQLMEGKKNSKASSGAIGEESIKPLKSESDLSHTDPRAVHPKLNLSGRIISATFLVPYNIGFAPDADWNLTPRRGTSALFDSFSYLASSSSPWNHTLVGWTGEIRKEPGAFPTSEAGTGMPDAISQTTNPAAAPIPVDGTIKPPTPSNLGLRIKRSDRERLEKQLQYDHGGKIVPVWLVDTVDKEEDAYVIKNQTRWRRFAETELYPLFHYKQQEPTDGRASRQAWADYYRMNKQFADRILEIYQPGDIVLIHDYSLMLLPSMLRQRIPNIYSGFFLHVPFPSSEYFRCLSRRKELLEGMLGANMVGFQAYSYSRHFASCCTRVLGYDSSSTGIDAYGVHVSIDVFSIGINAASIQHVAFNDPAVDEKARAIREVYGNCKIIIGRDRLDTVRGVAQKLQAFEEFLEKYPQWRGKVVLIQITSPSQINTEGNDGETRFINKISDLVAKINGEYGSLSFTPVQHFPQYLAKEEYFALLRVADVGLITSVRDGMNTTSLEYIICQKENKGQLILSEFSGTASILADAIHVNPWDFNGVADAINKALTMPPEERTATHDALYKHVVTHNVQAWTNGFLKRLLTNLESFDHSIATPALDRTKLLLQYRAAKKRLFLFDYDGTLTPIVRDPQAAIPSDRIIRTLKTLASDPKNAVWIISGRDQAFLDEWMGHIPELGLSAEHGSFMRYPQHDEWENITEHLDMGWQQEVLDVFQQYTEKTQGSFIERKKIALTWHYRRADPEYGLHQAQLCQKELTDTVVKKYDVDVMTGKANLEVRPRFVNKGEIAKRLVEGYGADEDKPEFVLCLGDDFTDEDMFRALHQTSLPPSHLFTTTVGPSNKQTLATWHLLEPADVISTISGLTGSTDSGNVGPVAVIDGVVPESRL